jgi:hypothetical protein
MRESGVGTTAYFVKAAKKGKRDDKPNGQKKKKCTHCKIRGHDASKCQKLKKEKEEAKAKNESANKPKSVDASAKIAVAEDEPASDSDTVCLFKVSQDPST